VGIYVYSMDYWKKSPKLIARDIEKFINIA
jgi:hypothetical protein